MVQIRRPYGDRSSAEHGARPKQQRVSAILLVGIRGTLPKQLVIKILWDFCGTWREMDFLIERQKKIWKCIISTVCTFVHEYSKVTQNEYVWPSLRFKSEGRIIYFVAKKKKNLFVYVETSSSFVYLTDLKTRMDQKKRGLRFVCCLVKEIWMTIFLFMRNIIWRRGYYVFWK